MYRKHKPETQSQAEKIAKFDLVQQELDTVERYLALVKQAPIADASRLDLQMNKVLDDARDTIYGLNPEDKPLYIARLQRLQAELEDWRTQRGSLALARVAFFDLPA